MIGWGGSCGETESGSETDADEIGRERGSLNRKRGREGGLGKLEERRGYDRGDRIEINAKQTGGRSEDYVLNAWKL